MLVTQQLCDVFSFARLELSDELDAHYPVVWTLMTCLEALATLGAALEARNTVDPTEGAPESEFAAWREVRSRQAAQERAGSYSARRASGGEGGEGIEAGPRRCQNYHARPPIVHRSLPLTN